MPEISWGTARWQWAQVMPVTVKVVEPMNVRGVLDSMGTPRTGWWCAVRHEGGRRRGDSHRGNRRDRSQWGAGPAWSVGTVPLVLVGRDAERAAIAALLAAARGGRGGALVVRGVAGSGKSTLLADALASAGDLRVLRTSGVESESPLAFAALQRLLWPLRSRVEGLPAPQRSALRAALGEAEGEGDRFLVFLATLSLLADAAEEQPILAVVDDAHWLDDASAAALLFAGRRLQAERIALLFAAREGSERRFEADGVPSIELGGVAGTAAD